MRRASEREGTIGTWLLLLAKAAVGGIAEVDKDAGTVFAGDNSREGVSGELSEDGTFGTGDGVRSGWEVEAEKEAKQGWPEVV